MAKRVTVHPVEGRWLPGVPAAEADVDPEEAARLVESGAFTTEPPAPEPPADPQPEEN